MNSNDSLKQKMVKSSFFVMGANILSRLITLLSTFVLAKILTPEDFGVVGYGFLIVSTIGLIREMGFNSALVYQKRNVEEAASTAFWFVLLWSFCLYLGSFFLAPIAAVFFKEPRIVSVLRVLSLSLVFTSIANIPMTLMEKEIEFKKRVAPDVIGLTLYSVVTILLAYLGLGYWSFVIGTLLSDILQIFISFGLRPVKIFIKPEKKIFKELFGFGRNIMLLNVTNFLIRNIDDFFVGKMLGTVSLGIYQFSYRIGNIPATNITNVFGKILYPGFAKIAGNISRLKKAFLNSFRYISFLTIPLTIYIVLIIPDFTEIFLPKWVDAIIPIQLLAYFGGLRALGSGIGSVFLAKGYPGKLVPISIFQLLVILVLIYPLVKIKGVIGACIIIDISQTVAFVMGMIIGNRIIGLRLIDYLTSCGKIVFLSAVSLILVVSIRFIAVRFYGFSHFGCFLIDLSYILVYFGLQILPWGELKSMIREIRITLKTGDN